MAHQTVTCSHTSRVPLSCPLPRVLSTGDTVDKRTATQPWCGHLSISPARLRPASNLPRASQPVNICAPNGEQRYDARPLTPQTTHPRGPRCRDALREAPWETTTPGAAGRESLGDRLKREPQANSASKPKSRALQKDAAACTEGTHVCRPAPAHPGGSRGVTGNSMGGGGRAPCAIWDLSTL